jgi:glycosyltransferase involved in cell wall biosynthesis
VIDGVNGLLTPIDDVLSLREALARLLSDEALRQSLIANGFETYSQGFTPEAVTARWIEFYETVEQNVGLTALKDRNKFAA